jgi:hypothetical protein
MRAVEQESDIRLNAPDELESDREDHIHQEMQVEDPSVAR